METAQFIEFASQGTASSFTLAQSFWIVWFLVAIALLWTDLVHKVAIGSLSIAAILTIFISFFAPIASQILVFCFVAAVIYVGSQARKDHHHKLKHYYVH